MVSYPAEWGNKVERLLHGVCFSMDACAADKWYLGVGDTDVCYQSILQIFKYLSLDRSPCIP